MRISNKYHIHEVAGQHIVLLLETDHHHVLHLKGSSFFLWESLQNKNFDIQDAVNLLLEKYDVPPHQAQTDAEKWILQLKELGIITM